MWIHISDLKWKVISWNAKSCFKSWIFSEREFTNLSLICIYWLEILVWICNNFLQGEQVLKYVAIVSGWSLEQFYYFLMLFDLKNPVLWLMVQWVKLGFYNEKRSTLQQLSFFAIFSRQKQAEKAPFQVEGQKINHWNWPSFPGFFFSKPLKLGRGTEIFFTI